MKLFKLIYHVIVGNDHDDKELPDGIRSLVTSSKGKAIGPGYCCFYNMTVSDTRKRNVILSFKSIADLSKFKHECDCNDFYIDRDLLTLVGDFIETQIQMAINKYDASCEYAH